jgi:hypothetical protein
VLFGPPAAFAAQATHDWTRQGTNIVIAGALCLLLLWLVTRGLPAAASGHGAVPATPSK